MAFNYQLLKKLTTQSVTDESLETTSFANTTIATANIKNNTILEDNINDAAINYSTSTVTGTMPRDKGGTGLSTIGSNQQLLRRTSASGNALEYANLGFSGIAVFTSNGTWNKPAGVRYIRVKVQAGGGGASGHGESGGAGGYAERIMNVDSISAVSCNIGGGGGGTYYSGAGGNGAGSSFGPYVSANGGHGANRQNQHSGGVSGNGSGGNLNIHSGGGFNHHARSAQSCANTFFGGGAPGTHPQGGNFGHNHQGYTAPGTGGAGAYFHGHRGSDGRPGIIIITEYY